MVAFELSENCHQMEEFTCDLRQSLHKREISVMQSAKYDFLTELFISGCLGRSKLLNTLFPSGGQETSARDGDCGFLLLLSTKTFFLFIQIIQCYVLFSAIIIYVVNSPPKNCLLWKVPS